ncbi:MAG TPA: hypothetical protein PKO06_06695 [Candidatus Ozemobacteraceae bacterium]|nr:hypothetical protein [Candidatus Ozemobacteraceae bacterium]
MFSSSLHCRSWGVNRGEEEFLGPVGMITLAWCSATCPHCYLSEQQPEIVQVPLDAFPHIIAEMRERGAKSLYIVNPERQGEPLTRVLRTCRETFPDFPVVLKLGGHESSAEIEPLLDHVDACSLDVKAFCADTAAALGLPDLLTRTEQLVHLVSDKLGRFQQTTRGVAGWWARHVGLPGRVANLEPEIRRRLGDHRPPIWFSREYRPFGRARKMNMFNRKLTSEERDSMCKLVQKLATEGWPAWLR